MEEEALTKSDGLDMSPQEFGEIQNPGQIMSSQNHAFFLVWFDGNFETLWLNYGNSIWVFPKNRGVSPKMDGL